MLCLKVIYGVLLYRTKKYRKILAREAGTL
jgi:hypothetical protein